MLWKQPPGTAAAARTLQSKRQAAAENKKTAAAATVLATEKAAAATGTTDVIVDFATDMLLWLEAFRPVTDAETQVIHEVMLLVFVTQFSAAQFILDMLI